MKRFFDNELESFRSQLVLMGEIAVRQVRQATEALVNSDLSLADQVAAADDELDQLEVKIDDEAIRYMSLRSPVATELRLVIVGMKASHDLERVGDEATNIVRRVARLASEPPLKPYIDIPRMSKIAIEMLRDALDCFLQEDIEKALAVCKRDAEVDDINRQLYRELTSYMIENPSTTSRALELMFISKAIERIADHASNIAEEMVYLARGRDIRHTEQTKNPNAG
ncbi:phosphate signaling complex protein PhoU [Synoicihabitans lomoniglobus]|uniref:Phosphate-specific transport system accessory protein PhoU n=1 Tax=Synoicihabitans lomoniglobus TaxID=2909285 RepID=A0AAF0I1Y1_9BACT|nr:phosphate signaling complex protein PhoU [Opitutaceae bacterium LMO-M01]WED66117.1 phosphate signaling complex protein PhoU [Opitutaceae bacterium LMO-M01]